ncbi:DUF1501 domain-containing protein [Verrucomicrobiales bacterium]|nr:DUF1501 domain-containing protein [Verrucomicrobiales bacterium]
MFQSAPTDRRRFLRNAAGSFLGVSFAQQTLFAGENIASGKRSPKRVIYLFMAGGMSHIDTLNPRPDAPSEIRGKFSAIKTNADGVLLSETLPGIGKHTDKAVVFNSLTSTQGAHQQGQYYMQTNYTKRGTISHPHLGAWQGRLNGKGNETLPGFIRINGGSNGPGNGFLPAEYAPLDIGKPSAGLENSAHYKGVGAPEFDKNLALARKLDQKFRARYDDRRISAYTSMYDDAVKLMRSGDLKAFDLGEETAEMRERYGDDSFGQGCLLARRLTERGVRFVEVRLGGWDTHADNFDRVAEKTATLDRAMSALIGDLTSRGQLEDTMVVLASEFGRTPKINQNAGRDHYPKAYSAMIVGGGIKGGQTYGTTDSTGAEVEENKLEVQSFNATVAYGMGADVNETIETSSRRPFTIANKGKAVTELWS